LIRAIAINSLPVASRNHASDEARPLEYLTEKEAQF
jgi:hypothetical protein